MAVIALISVCALLWRFLQNRGLRLGTSSGRRLKIKEILPIDPRRRLLLVQCDHREFLILLGSNQDVVLGTLQEDVTQR
ncbi:MAG: flagellar biosynthetic protein FliO [Holosporales bacterium]